MPRRGQLSFLPRAGRPDPLPFAESPCQVKPGSPHDLSRSTVRGRPRPRTRPHVVLLALVLGLLLALAPRLGRQTAAAPDSAPARWTAAVVGALHLTDTPPTVVDAGRVAARRQALFVRELGRLHQAPTAEARRDQARFLWVRATDASVQDAALEAILDDNQWPRGFRGRFLDELSESVLRAAREHRVLPSITLAQAILESGWGRSGLAAHHHNLFGVKAGSSSQRVRLATHEHSRGRLRPTRKTFRRYATKAESIEHHARLLGQDRRYARARSQWTDWRGFLEAIAPRYASSPTYVEAVAEIVELYELDRWDALIVAAAAVDDARSQS